MSTPFQATAVQLILSLPQDLKAMMRLVEDSDLDDADRVQCAGALLHLLSAQNAIPGVRGVLAFLDDAIVLRLVVERIAKSAPEQLATHQDESSDLLDAYADQLAETRAFLGDLIAVLEKAADGLPKLTHEGHTAPQCVRDTESVTWLYDEVLEAITRMDLDDEGVTRAVKNVDQILPPLRQRLAAMK